MREVIADVHCIMCSTMPELGSQVSIKKDTVNLVHDYEVKSLSQSIQLRAVFFRYLMSDSLLA
jgi:hypothetical protein